MWDWLSYVLFGDRGSGYIPDAAFHKLEKAIEELEALIKGT